MFVGDYSLRFVALFIPGDATLLEVWILHVGEYMMDSNACYCCGKPGHMGKDYLNKTSQEQGKERVLSNGPSEEAPRRQ